HCRCQLLQRIDLPGRSGRSGASDNRGSGLFGAHDPDQQLFPYPHIESIVEHMIEVRQLCKSFGTQSVLNGVNLQIEKGDRVVIIGRSGGGKSVLLKLIIGLMRPDSGEVLIDGQNIATISERQLLNVRHRFGMLFQAAALFDSMSVADNVAFALRRERKWTPQQIERKVDE